MKKFLSIMMIALMIVITIVGITACTSDESDKLVGIWICVEEDSENYPYAWQQTEEGRIYSNYYAVITKSDEKGSDNLIFKSYAYFPTSGRYAEQDNCKIVPKEDGKYFISANFQTSDIAKGSYYLTIQVDDTILIEPYYSNYDRSKYTFRRTGMTLEEFKATYGHMQNG